MPWWLDACCSAAAAMTAALCPWGGGLVLALWDRALEDRWQKVSFSSQVVISVRSFFQKVELLKRKGEIWESLFASLHP